MTPSSKTTDFDGARSGLPEHTPRVQRKVWGPWCAHVQEIRGEVSAFTVSAVAAKRPEKQKGRSSCPYHVNGWNRRQHHGGRLLYRAIFWIHR